MVGFEGSTATRLLPVAGVVLVLCLGVGGCGQAADPPAGSQTPTAAAPAGSSTPAPAPGQAAPEAAASEGVSAASGAGETPTSGTTMSAEEISQHFKVKTTDAAAAAAAAVEESAKKVEAAVDEATR